jgi:hypothetical protein
MDGRRVRRDPREADGLSAPDLVDVETVSVLRKRWLAGPLTDRRSQVVVRDAAESDYSARERALAMTYSLGLAGPLL